jgi:hypothetical protein
MLKPLAFKMHTFDTERASGLALPTGLISRALSDSSKEILVRKDAQGADFTGTTDRWKHCSLVCPDNGTVQLRACRTVFKRAEYREFVNAVLGRIVDRSTPKICKYGMKHR